MNSATAKQWAKQRGSPVLKVLASILLLVTALAPAFVVREALHPDDRAEVARALGRCLEKKARRAATPSSSDVELQANRARPTLTIALADRLSAEDSISFSSKDRKRVQDSGRATTSAVFIETPRRSASEPMDGTVTAKATSELGQTIVRLTVCVDRGALLKAGAFQGTVRIYGPKVSDFDYAVVITEKWPWQIAAATLWYAGLAFVLVAWLTRSITFERTRTGLDKWVAPLAGIVFGFVAMTPAFFGAYWNNPTWGSDPGTQVLGLATAGFTAALAGLATAQKIMKPPG